VKLSVQALTVVLGFLIAGYFSPLASAKDKDKDKDESKWIEIHTGHFSVITDAGDKRGREVALRMEQMRSVFGELLLKDKLKMPIPITVIALKSDKQYGLVAPTKQSMTGGFYVPGWDRIYIVLNLFEADPWRAVAHPPPQGGNDTDAGSGRGEARHAPIHQAAGDLVPQSASRLRLGRAARRACRRRGAVARIRACFGWVESGDSP